MAKRKLHEVSLKDDIRYRGPLSYQAFQLLGWLCIAASALIVVLKLQVRADPETEEENVAMLLAVGYATSLSLPFLMIANFSRILTNTEGYRAQIFRTGGTALAIFLGSAFLFDRYVVQVIGHFVNDPDQVMPGLELLIHDNVKNGFVAYNIFVDLFLCALFMFFLNARPKRVFTGKRLVLFRLFAILPVAYEVASLVLKGMEAADEIVLPLWTCPLLTVKPPMTFLVFIVLAVHIKTRERRFCRHGRTHEEYQAFLGTNRNSLHFSAFICLILAAAAILDLGIAMIMTSAGVSADDPDQVDRVMRMARITSAMGFGDSIPLFFLLPIIPLFSYNRVPRNRSLSMLIPIAGIALMILIYIESAAQYLLSVETPADSNISFADIIRGIRAFFAE